MAAPHAHVHLMRVLVVVIRHALLHAAVLLVLVIVNPSLPTAPSLATVVLVLLVVTAHAVAMVPPSSVAILIKAHASAASALVLDLQTLGTNLEAILRYSAN
jgi:hypothetical protein